MAEVVACVTLPLPAILPVMLPVTLPVMLPVTLPVMLPVVLPIKPFVDVTGPVKVVDAMICFPFA